MAIAVNDLDIGYRGVTNTTLPQFAGRNRQIVINVDDNYRPVIMDGQTLGGKSKVALLTDLNDIMIDVTDLKLDTYGTQTLGTGSSQSTTSEATLTITSALDQSSSLTLMSKDASNHKNTLVISPTKVTMQ